MPQIDQAFYEGVLRRIKRIILVLGIAGTVVLTPWKGIRGGGGFLIGAAVSYVSFWRWERVVEALGSAPARTSPWLFVLRFVVLMAAGYVIIRVTGVNQGAALTGLLVPGAAATVEIIYELILWNTKQNSG
ncbi:MAG TPA: hypothetical protein VGV35_05660 [Bryobacteraceae bacterium]|nr:hypothetical protein [Bryobacteraceae bacterium]